MYSSGYYNFRSSRCCCFWFRRTASSNIIYTDPMLDNIWSSTRINKEYIRVGLRSVFADWQEWCPYPRLDSFSVLRRYHETLPSISALFGSENRRQFHVRLCLCCTSYHDHHQWITSNSVRNMDRGGNWTWKQRVIWDINKKKHDWRK